MLHTTFSKLHEAGACIGSYCKLAKHMGGIAKYGKDTPIPLSEILSVCGLDDALWALQAIVEPADREIRLLACDFAERVLPIFEKLYPNDKRPRAAIETARRYANGEATIEELNAARSAAWDAAWDAARSAARYAARYAAWSAAESAARYAAWYAARYADWYAEKEWQEQRFRQLLDEEVR